MSDEFEKLMPEFMDLARRIFEAGRRAEYERLFGMFQAASELETPSIPAPQPYARPKANSRRIQGPVRDAVLALSPGMPGGVSPDEVFDFLAQQGGDLTRLQIRSALKNLALSGGLSRESRGRYSAPTAGVSVLGGENSDASASEALSLAAE